VGQDKVGLSGYYGNEERTASVFYVLRPLRTTTPSLNH